MRYLILFFVIFSLLSYPVLAIQISADSIAKKMEETNVGYNTAKMLLSLHIHDAKSQKDRTYDLKIEAFESKENDVEEKSIIFFSKPLNVRGTALLSYSHSEASDQQWIYLPALKRVKRILTKNKDGRFMGSTFSYEDLLPFNYEKYQHTRLDDRTYLEKNCFVVEQKPQYEGSGYSKRVVWIDSSRFIPLKIEFYDDSGIFFKEMIYDNYENFKGFWRAKSITMNHLITGNTSRLSFSDIDIGVQISANSFNPNRLKNLR